MEIRAHDLLSRAVVDAQGKTVGHVQEIVAEGDGANLVITGLLLGPGAWITRFGWARGRHGRYVSWDEVASWAPRITLKGTR